MSADLTLKTTQDNGDIQSVEIFILEGGFVLHRHCLTEDEQKAKLYGIYRKFWNKFYTMQVIVLARKEVIAIIDAFATNETIQNKIKNKIKK